MAITDRYHILRALADGEERHGYTIMEAIEAATDGKVILAPGTLYRAIARLLEDGLIVEEAVRPAPDLEDERRRYYRITPRGQALLANPGVPLAPLAPVALHGPWPAPGAVSWRGALSFGVTWGAATGGLLLLLGAGHGAGWATGAVATVVTTGAGLLRRAEAA